MSGYRVQTVHTRNGWEARLAIPLPDLLRALAQILDHSVQNNTPAPATAKEVNAVRRPDTVWRGGLEYLVCQCTHRSSLHGREHGRCRSTGCTCPGPNARSAGEDS